MTRLFASGLVAISVGCGAALLAIALATRPAEPSAPPAASHPVVPAATAPVAAPAETAETAPPPVLERPEAAPSPSAAPAAPPHPAALPAQPPLWDEPVVPLPEDRDRRAEILQEVRRKRVARMLEAQILRGRKAVAEKPPP